jgi:hypothetical protein
MTGKNAGARPGAELAGTRHVVRSIDEVQAVGLRPFWLYFSPRGGRATVADLSETKQQLEIEKLKLEMRYIKRNHYAQIFNTACLVLVGLIVFYFPTPADPSYRKTTSPERGSSLLQNKRASR